MKPLYKSKTFWTAVGGAVTAVGAYMTGDLTGAQAVAAVLAAATAIFLRDGVNSAARAAAMLLVCVSLVGCATSQQPQDQTNRGQLGEAGDKDVVAVGFGAVGTTKAGARLHDVDPRAGAGGEILEPIVLWNPVTETWEVQVDANGNVLMKKISSVRNYHNYIGSTLSVTATGTGTTEGQQTQGADAKADANPSNTTDVDGTVTPGN